MSMTPRTIGHVIEFFAWVTAASLIIWAFIQQ